MINMTRDEEIAFNNFTDLLGKLIAKHGHQFPDLPEDKRKLRKRLKMYAQLLAKSKDDEIAA